MAALRELMTLMKTCGSEISDSDTGTAEISERIWVDVDPWRARSLELALIPCIPANHPPVMIRPHSLQAATV